LAASLASPVQAADIPQAAPVAAAPVIEQRVASTFSSFGPYIGIRGGAAFVDDTSFTITGPNTVTNEYEDWGLTGSAFAGWGTEFFPGFGGRVEAELGYSSFDIEDHFVGGAAVASPTGDTSAFTGVVNTYVDASLGAFRPFAGVGLGVAQVNFNDHGTAGTVLMDDSDTALVWQLSGGVGYSLTPKLTLEGMVRYQSIEDVELTSTAAGGDLDSSTDLTSTSALVGLRYGF
ncbi:MAG: porin family protein, partial [Devosiaceae bacterium]|nr:porin family protein [Devosiaceae bacterium MH13]